APSRLCAARQSLEEALCVLRGQAAELGSSPSKEGLNKALERYLEGNVPPEVHAELACRGDLRLIAAEAGDQLYFVIREAVRNALLHSGATELRVTLEVREKLISATVEDSGCGLDINEAMEASQRKGSGGGLRSMQERVDLIGGMFMLTSLPG